MFARKHPLALREINAAQPAREVAGRFWHRRDPSRKDERSERLSTSVSTALTCCAKDLSRSGCNPGAVWWDCWRARRWSIRGGESGRKTKPSCGRPVICPGMSATPNSLGDELDRGRLSVGLLEDLRVEASALAGFQQPLRAAFWRRKGSVSLRRSASPGCSRGREDALRSRPPDSSPAG
jgi:hypothetical protein